MHIAHTHTRTHTGEYTDGKLEWTGSTTEQAMLRLVHTHTRTLHTHTHKRAHAHTLAHTGSCQILSRDFLHTHRCALIQRQPRRVCVCVSARVFRLIIRSPPTPHYHLQLTLIPSYWYVCFLAVLLSHAYSSLLWSLHVRTYTSKQTHVHIHTHTLSHIIYARWPSRAQEQRRNTHTRAHTQSRRSRSRQSESDRRLW